MMVANVRCGEIMREKLEALQQTEAYLELCRLSAIEVLPTFGGLSSDDLIKASLAGLPQHHLTAAQLHNYYGRCARLKAGDESMVPSRFFLQRLGLLEYLQDIVAPFLADRASALVLVIELFCHCNEGCTIFEAHIFNNNNKK